MPLLICYDEQNLSLCTLYGVRLQLGLQLNCDYAKIDE